MYRFLDQPARRALSAPYERSSWIRPSSPRITRRPPWAFASSRARLTTSRLLSERAEARSAPRFSARQPPFGSVVTLITGPFPRDVLDEERRVLFVVVFRAEVFFADAALLAAVFFDVERAEVFFRVDVGFLVRPETVSRTRSTTAATGPAARLPGGVLGAWGWGLVGAIALAFSIRPPSCSSRSAGTAEANLGRSSDSSSST